MHIQLIKTAKKSVLYFCLVLLVILGFYFYPEKKISSNIIIDKILVQKSKHLMSVYADGSLIKTYKIALGYHPIGKKRFERDGRTPEGLYYIISKNNHSRAYKSFGISYPNAEDKKYAQLHYRRTGGDIMIHGLLNEYWYYGKFHRIFDWTGGCIAVTNNEMDELFKCVNIGCRIEICK